MKQIITIAVLTAMASLANAGEVNSGKSKDKGYEKVSYEVGSELYSETYKEYNTEANNAVFMKETATMYGVNGKVSYLATPLDLFSAKVRYATGESKYTGSLQTGTYGSLVIDGQDRHVWEVSAEYKHKFVELKNLNIGVSVNHRQLTDRLDQAGEVGYKRVNQLTYAGLSMDKEFYTNGWKVTPKFTAKALLDGKQKSYLLPEFTLAHKQNSGHGYDLEVAFVKKVSKYDLTISPYFKSMSLRNSDQVILTDGTDSIVTMEPKNKTTEAGVNVGLQF